MRATEDRLQFALVQHLRQVRLGIRAFSQGIQVSASALPWVLKPDLNPAVWNTSLSSQFFIDTHARESAPFKSFHEHRASWWRYWSPLSPGLFWEAFLRASYRLFLSVELLFFYGIHGPQSTLPQIFCSLVFDSKCGFWIPVCQFSGPVILWRYTRVQVLLNQFYRASFWLGFKKILLVWDTPGNGVARARGQRGLRLWALDWGDQLPRGTSLRGSERPLDDSRDTLQKWGPAWLPSPWAVRQCIECDCRDHCQNRAWLSMEPIDKTSETWLQSHAHQAHTGQDQAKKEQTQWPGGQCQKVKLGQASKSNDTWNPEGKWMY